MPAGDLSRDEPRGDRRGRRAEPALERDAVDEAEAVAVERREQRERAQREMSLVARDLVGADALDLDERLALLGRQHVQLVPQVERRTGAVEPRAEVRRRRRRLHDELHTGTSPASSASRMESTLGSTSTA